MPIAKHILSRAGFLFSLTVLLLAGISGAAGQKIQGPIVGYPIQSAVSLPVRAMVPQAISHRGGPPQEKPLHRVPRQSAPSVVDPVIQTSTPTPATTIGLSQWEGLGAGYPGFTVTAVPPDTNMAVGPNHIIQWVNGGIVVFDKMGHELQAPVDDGTFWGALSTCNQLGGFSDPVVQYDRIADRWIIGEIGLPLLPPYFGQFAQCFAVSTGSDPTGSYYQWAYGFGSDIPDYPKISVWPDGYYITWNIFPNGGATFAGPEACAFNHRDMLRGASAPSYVCFTLPNTYASLLPSDLDGSTQPPSGSPNFLMDVDAAAGTLHLWTFHVNFAHPSSSTFSGTSLSGVAPFNAPCLATRECIPQPGTSQKLDAIGDRLMYRLAYRNFGDHESLVANHSVIGDNGAIGIRWYEVRSPDSSPFIYQQGTFSPDNDNRWMGSIAQDNSGDIAVGYSVSSAGAYPSIRYSGWQVGDTLGTLQTEIGMVSGAGSQTGYNRWGDYSAMQIDPSDDCTFWYTQEYQAVNASANWSTRIGSFKFDSCDDTSTKTSTTTSLSSSGTTSNFGDPVTFTATVAPFGTGSVTFYDGTTPLGSSPLDGSGQASLTTSSLSAGSHQITAAYSGDASYAASASAPLTQTVNNTSTNATTTTLSSNRNPAKSKQPITFTATVSPSNATGTVQFKDGSNNLGAAVTLSSGTASLMTKLPSGTHLISAVYSGDSTYSGSTSNTVSQTVQ
jgi:hypothetical protein